MNRGAALPPDLEQPFRWNDETLMIRPISRSDERAFLEFAARLEPEDLRMRFFGCPHRLSHDELVRLTCVDKAHGLALVAVRSTGGGDEILGVARAMTAPGDTDAELGIIVRSDLKSEGLGWLLLHGLIARLGDRGPRRLIAFVLHENLAMIQLARASGFVVDVAGSDAQAFRLVLDLHASPGPDRDLRPAMPAAAA